MLFLWKSSAQAVSEPSATFSEPRSSSAAVSAAVADGPGSLAEPSFWVEPAFSRWEYGFSWAKQLVGQSWSPTVSWLARWGKKHPALPFFRFGLSWFDKSWGGRFLAFDAMLGWEESLGHAWSWEWGIGSQVWIAYGGPLLQLSIGVRRQVFSAGSVGLRLSGLWIPENPAAVLQLFWR